jgi:2-keto-4-pentenoate hydratase
LADINVLGPTAVASDFGNNAGLILGPPIADWQKRAFESLSCETTIDGICVGRGNALSLVGGPVESLRFLLENCARRGRPLKTGTLVATGAVTGIHDIRSGQVARIDFGPYGAIDCRAESFAGGTS